LPICTKLYLKKFEDTKWGNQKLQIKEGQAIQWPIAKGKKDKKRSTKHTQKIKDRALQTPLQKN
jgi:hypothetical protein